MAWQPIPGNPYWEYDDNPPSPGVTSPHYKLWLKQTAGIRTHGANQVYVKCRLVGSTDPTDGEISKTYWDHHNAEYVEPPEVIYNGYPELTLAPSNKLVPEADPNVLLASFPSSTLTPSTNLAPSAG